MPAQMRRVFLDVETTGRVSYSDSIIEIGAIEVVDERLGRDFYYRVKPLSYQDGPWRGGAYHAYKKHGIRNEELKCEPQFAEIWDELKAFVTGAEVFAHNASFDRGFLDAELRRIGKRGFATEAACRVTCTLAMARRRGLPGPHTLDALCRRCGIGRSSDYHSALEDAELLAQVYMQLLARGHR